MKGQRRPAVAIALAIAASTWTSPALAAGEGYYSVAYSDTLYRHTHGVGAATVVAATYEEWRADGFPTPVPAPAEYVAYPWSPEIFAVYMFDGDRASWLWIHLDEEQWSAVGRPSPRVSGWIVGSQFWSYGGSTEVFVRIGDDGRQHRLTFAEWLDAGSPTPASRGDEAFYRYAWSPSVGHMVDRAYGFGSPISYDDWVLLDRPAPTVVENIRGQRVWRHAGSEQLYLDSAITGQGCPLTFEQWSALGRPGPVDV